MHEIRILKSQKNDVLDLIRGVDLDPFNFEWGTEPSQFDGQAVVAKLSYKGTDYCFIFDMKQNEHYSFFSPGRDKLFDEEFSGAWATQFGCVARWLETLKREVDAPDDWATLSRYQLPRGARVDPSVENSPFTAREVGQLTAGLDTIRAYLKEQTDSDREKAAAVDTKIDYLVESAKRQGRQDWFHTCVGALLGLLTSLALSPDQTKQVWHLLKACLSGIVRLLPG